MTEHVFAYGSNMCSGRLRKYGVKEATGEPATLAGYRLCFDKRSKDGSGKANVEHDGEGEVWGVLYALSDESKKVLDGAEKGYTAKQMKVRAAAGLDKTAWVFVANSPDPDPDLRPYHWYKRLLVEGAREHGLPAAYVQQLKAVEAKDDPDPDREKQMYAIPCTRTRLPIANYLNIHAAYSPVFTAGGSQVAFISNISGTPQLWQAAVPPAGEEPRWPDPLSFEGDRVLGVWAAPDGRSLLYSQDVGGNEKAQLLLRRPDGTTTTLTAGHETAMHNFGCWAADGRSFFMSANRRHSGRFDLYRQSLAGGEAELVYAHEQAGYLLPVDAAPDGSRLLLIRAAASASHELFELRLADRQLRRLSPADEPARYHAAFYSVDGSTALVNTDLGYDFLYLARCRLEDAVWEPFVRQEWDIEAFSMSHNRQRAAYTLNVGGASECYLLEPAGGRRSAVPLPPGPPGVAAWYGERISFSADDSQIAFDYTSATRTADVLVWRIGEETCRQATRSSHGGIPPESFVSPALVSYPTFDRRQIPGWFYKPAQEYGPGGMPVVVLVHGGPESQFRPYFHFLVQYLAHSGYAVFAPNVRGSTGYGKAYSRLDDVERRMDSAADLEHANLWLRGQPGVDPQRIAVYGGSYGGFMVLAALTSNPELWAAGIDVVGISNFVTFLRNTSDYRRAHRESEYGSLERDREFLESISPSNHLERVSAPLMVVHGANDPRVPLSEAEQLAAALRGRDVPVELLVFDDEGHGIVKLHNKRVLYPAMAAFLERHLGG